MDTLEFLVSIFFRAYNIPEKYVKQIEKRFDSLQNAKFTKAYHGKK